jgi:hypothetical protein
VTNGRLLAVVPEFIPGKLRPKHFNSVQLCLILISSMTKETLIATMALDGIVDAAPNVLEALTRELFNRHAPALHADRKSQLTACLQLGLRAASITHGMSRVLDLHTFDSYETLNRAAIEARDLLMHFRFDDEGTRRKVGYWFAGKPDNAWKADHARLDEFLTKQNVLLNTSLGESWSSMSVLTHPTMYAADNSSVVIINRIAGRVNDLDRINITLKRADYVVGIARLFLATVYDVPGWIPLGLNLANIPDVQQFCINAELVGGPILNDPNPHPLPDHSIRPPKKKP